MQLTDEAKKQVVAEWSAIVEILGRFYAMGGIQKVEQSMSLNASIQFIDGILKDALLKDCQCKE